MKVFSESEPLMYFYDKNPQDNKTDILRLRENITAENGGYSYDEYFLNIRSGFTNQWVEDNFNTLIESARTQEKIKQSLTKDRELSRSEVIDILVEEGNKRTYTAQQFKRAVELFINSLAEESQMMEVADIYAKYQTGRSYHIGDIFKYGVNEDNETQLYKVLQNHTSASQWRPDMTPSLYKKIGYSQEGYNIWTQPYGASDAYQLGDKVSHNGKNYESTYNGANVWEPGIVGEQFWKEI